MTAPAPDVLAGLRPAPDAPLPLVLHGQPVLHRPAEPVTAFDDALAALVEAMFETMYAAPGVGLAAPQVGVGLRVFVYDVGGGRRGHVVNPVLERVPGELQTDLEGCLSAPGLEYDTPRALAARVTGVDVTGAPVVVEGEGLLARCLQHEVDHLDGMLYLDRLGGRTRKQAAKDVRAADWHGDAHRVLTRADVLEQEARRAAGDDDPDDDEL